MIVIMSTFETKELAGKVGRGLLEQRLIACYNLWPVESAYWWKGKIEQQHEVVMLMKSTVRWFDDISEYIKKESGYETPEVIAFDSEKVEPYYQQWLNDETK